MAKGFENNARAKRYDLQVLGRILMDEPAAQTEPGGSFLCNVINMSLSGALVETGEVMPVGSLVNYSFRMPGGKETVKVHAEIIRREAHKHLLLDESSGQARPRSGRAHGLLVYGIRFLDLKDSDKQAIKGCLG